MLCNYLFPQRLAVPLTQANKRQIEALRQRRAEREAHEFNTMSELSKGVAKLICLRQGQGGRGRQDVRLGDSRRDRRRIETPVRHLPSTRRKIHLETRRIRTLGDHEIELHLHAEVKGTLKVRVESLTPITAPVVETAPAEMKTEKRGRRAENRSRRRQAQDRQGRKADESRQISEGGKESQG